MDIQTQSEFLQLKKLLAQQKVMDVTVASGSMEPVLMTGDQVQVRYFDSSKVIRRFDIVVFWSGKRLTCHYVQHLNRIPSAGGEKVYITRGLQNSFEDLPVNESNILGLVLREIPLWWKLKITWKALF